MRAFAIALLLLSSLTSAAQEITVAAAADLRFALEDVKDRFEKENGERIKLVFGSSGKLFTQIQNGAPFDLFFSADIEYPQKLEAAGLTEPGTLYEYATGKLVLWAPRDSVSDLRRGLAILLDPQIKKIAIANPAHAPYGRAAVAALKHEGIYDRVADKLILGEDISQTASFVVSGSADIGMVALSLALAPSLKEKGKYAEIDSGDYPPIRQAAIVLKSSQNKPAAEKFLDYMKKPTVTDIMKGYGFSHGKS